MEKLTIFTPTYNRRDQIIKLYYSLCRQTISDFVWLIVDDGSVDGTQAQVERWIEEKRVFIQYYRQKNSGKYKALEQGIAFCETPWFICVDSDDQLENNAVQTMVKDIALSRNANCIGFIYPRRMREVATQQWMPENVNEVHIVDTRILYGVTETAILCKTEYLKKLIFKQFPEEKFVSEEVLYVQLVQYGKFVVRKDAFYLSEYQQDGLTKNLFKHWIENPRSTIFLLRGRFCDSVRYPPWICLRERIKCILNLNAVCLCCNLPIKKHTPSLAYSYLLYFPSILWREMRFIRY